jgi:hypothetical protein
LRSRIKRITFAAGINFFFAAGSSLLPIFRDHLCVCKDRFYLPCLFIALLRVLIKKSVIHKTNCCNFEYVIKRIFLVPQ